MKTIHLSAFSLWMLIALFNPLNLYGQPEVPLFDNWQAADKSAIEALALYPQDTRVAILTATQYPELLIKTESKQRETSAAFQDLVAGFSQEEQASIYDLSRYPGLISRLALAVETGQKDPGILLQDYPEVIHNRARNVFSQYGGLLLKIDQLQQMADQQFMELPAAYPEVAQQAFKALIELPEVLNLLTENIRMTVLVGDLYRQHPDQLQQQLDSLNRVVAEANAGELKNWEAGVENSPEVMDELKSASEEFAREYGYDDQYYDYDDMYYAGDAENQIMEQHFYYHYPYWLGYPSWYYYPRWRPYPAWYESGFYLVPDGRFLIHRLPSFYFTYWYFHRPYHHYYYPRLSRQFVRHTYYGPRPGTSSIAVNVRSWRERNRELITETWLQDDRGSIERFREYGKFEMDLEKYNLRRPEKALSPTDYLERNTSKYPELIRSGPTRQTGRPAVSPRPKTEAPAPVRKENDRLIVPPGTERQRVRVLPPAPKTERKQNVPKVDKGVENHRATIERYQRTQPKIAPRTVPKTPPKIMPKAAPKTKPTRTKESG